VESSRADALFDDPFAAHFAGTAALEAVARSTRKDGRIAVRTRFFDDALANALRAAPGAQVVLLGAGLDARAWRLSPPDGTPRCSLLLEVDRADVLCAKAALLRSLYAPAPLRLCEAYAAVACDLTSAAWPEALRSAGHRPEVPTVWLLEGLLYYLPSSTVDSLLRTCAACSAPGSAVLASCVNTPALLRARSNGKSAAMRAFQSAVDQPESYFLERGWTVQLALRPGDPGCSFGRFPPPEDITPDGPKTFYITARST
jgi:methyltransferase (TIGR00027 family)